MNELDLLMAPYGIWLDVYWSLSSKSSNWQTRTGKVALALRLRNIADPITVSALYAWR